MFKYIVNIIINQIIIQHYRHFMDLNPEAKKAIKELPPTHRITALALKKISDQIMKIYEEQKKQIDSNHLSFISRFKKIEVEASSIIQGRELEKDDLSEIEQYLNPEEQQKLDGVMKSKQPIKDYWLVALKNSDLSPLLSSTEELALPFLKNIESNVTVDCIELILTFEDSQWIKGGKYRRSVKISQLGEPQALQGEQFTFIKYASDEDKDLGLLNALGKNTTDSQQVSITFESITYLTNEFIPYSLNFYLGACEQLGEFEEGEQDDEQEDEESEEQAPRKKTKKQ